MFGNGVGIGVSDRIRVKQCVLQRVLGTADLEHTEGAVGKVDRDPCGYLVDLQWIQQHEGPMVWGFEFVEPKNIYE